MVNIVVCVKQVPDTWAERTLRAEDSRLDRASVDGVINELDEYAIEEDLVILGAESTDARMGVMAAMLAERLGVPQVSLASKVEVDGTALQIHRQRDYGYDKVESSLPAVISVVEKINEPRYPSFKGIMAAKKKPVETLTLADLGLDPGEVGLAAAATEVVSFASRPPRQAGTVVKDEGDGGTKAAEFLAAQKFI